MIHRKKNFSFTKMPLVAVSAHVILLMLLLSLLYCIIASFSSYFSFCGFFFGFFKLFVTSFFFMVALFVFEGTFLS